MSRVRYGDKIKAIRDGIPCWWRVVEVVPCGVVAELLQTPLGAYRFSWKMGDKELFSPEDIEWSVSR